jgi:hypothetical protein
MVIVRRLLKNGGGIILTSESNWESLLKVQEADTKQGVLTSDAPLPKKKPTKTTCKETMLQWVENAKKINQKFNLDKAQTYVRSGFHNMPEEVLCKIIEDSRQASMKKTYSNGDYHYDVFYRYIRHDLNRQQAMGGDMDSWLYIIEGGFGNPIYSIRIRTEPHNEWMPKTAYRYLEEKAELHDWVGRNLDYRDDNISKSQITDAKQGVLTSDAPLPKKQPNRKCKDKLVRVKEYLETQIAKINSQGQTVVDKINEVNPPKYGDNFRQTNLQNTQGEMKFVSKDEDDSFEANFMVKGSWYFTIGIYRLFDISKMTEEEACIVVDQFNDDASARLNGDANYFREEHANSNYAIHTTRYQGGAGYYDWNTLIEFSNRDIDWRPQIKISFSGGMGFPHSHEVYENIEEHNDYIRRLVGLRGIHEEVARIMRS